MQLQSLDEAGEAEAGSESDASVSSSKDAAPAATPAGGAGGKMPPRTASVEEIAKKKSQNRLSGSGLPAPSVGKSKRRCYFIEVISEFLECHAKPITPQGTSLFTNQKGCLNCCFNCCFCCMLLLSSLCCQLASIPFCLWFYVVLSGL